FVSRNVTLGSQVVSTCFLLTKVESLANSKLLKSHTDQ
ncbi:hypothetical protein pipiens_019924, partial [Culex pipiens pipiens]